ncbi:Hypothetical protein NTJ_04402 [Nesidiocoris tenuis]|uniref:Uncharacterized protein n=1 Tax=Nesidiocoris tenuis TaxID=355587 RepID=A0ABN7AJM4_9HEMI|nr:Hypothetical protein NTJ_04402 [Nesidiocoris tenuis]
MYDSRNRRDNLSVDITYAQVSHPSVPSIGIAKRFRLYRIHFYVYHDLTVNGVERTSTIVRLSSTVEDTTFKRSSDKDVFCELVLELHSCSDTL